MKYITLLLILTLTSCVTLDNTATIIKTETGVRFNTSQPCDMSMKDGETEYKYSGKSESLMTKIISILTLGAISTK